MKIKRMFTLLLTLLFCDRALACPVIDNIPDFNCDGKVIITALGDSLVAGFGDTKNDNQGGYLLRAQKKLPDTEVLNLGVPGLRSFELFDVIKKKFTADSDAINSDYVVLDIGRNDRWLFGTPGATYRNLKRASALVKKTIAEFHPETPPLVIMAVLMLPNRGSQGPWVKELNGIILRSNTDKAPADLRFDLVSKRLLSSDQIHPTSQGYDALTKTFVSYLQKAIPKKVKKLQPDTDGDGLPDELEVSVFGTDPNKVDSDGDGESDYREIFSKE
jgi:lysophospholipase L1-like esterase